MSEYGSPEEIARQWQGAAERQDLVLLDGFHALKHALRFGADVRFAVAEEPEAVRGLARELAPDVEADVARLVRRAPLKGLLARVHPTGVAALAVRPGRAEGRARLDARPRTAPIVLLDNPRNLGNVGAVVRLAAGFGATGVVTRGDLDPWHPNVVRAGAGLHYATTVDRVELDTLPPGPLYALDPEGEDIRALTLPDEALLAFGSERHGISPELRARADHLVSLPMRPQVSSYNLATSVAMTLFHWGGPRESL
ncbi:TrmH family RNA methyltransferase [Streptomyces sp. NBC_01264]|uniref:TrmH family RNA methyltransferase n=1 Tax=Streptomyces sp. NBC_01264 TaxID=2903804 RepID=UPI002251C365|nr:TrmH family RNA methyltransferase [Streptomyces sp. NBC_01264]MCX4779675.1 TrmH family RNA methyltransferase [Streptomyces sp. NBC_01264]